MPNHVYNEVTFSGISSVAQDSLLSSIVNKSGEIDFELLLPIPINVWQGDTGTEHQKAFKAGDCLHWSTKNWGTKWNAYSQRPIERTESTLTLRFETAWDCPRGWLLAIFNVFKLGFTYHYLSEDDDGGHTGIFARTGTGISSTNQWKESQADADTYARLRAAHFGEGGLP